MGRYVTNTREEQQEMLRAIGYESFDDLYRDVPEQMQIHGELKIPCGVSELEVQRRMEAMAAKNKVFPHIFRGAGAYHHYIPAIVDSVTGKEDFVTAYTPYQAEISQGNLQSIFEYQTMICELTGMDASNASVYDGATAAAEGVLMCLDRKRTGILVSAAVNPQVLKTIRTYCYGRNVAVQVIPEKEGATDTQALREMLDEQTACVYIQQPNYYGILEDVEEIGRLAHERKAKYVVGCNPISLAVLKTPREYQADVAVGEGQPLGMPMGFGGPYLGFMAAKQDMLRRLPGRIVGQTVDSQGKRGFVLTLQAREQHIRREKAGSNICSNEALCAMKASVYMAAMGPEGMRRAAINSASMAHYLAEKLQEAGCVVKYSRPFFHEFVTECPVDTGMLLTRLEEEGILGGLPLSGRELLWCATELNTKEEIDHLAGIVKEVCGR
ncbi:aminomethyl-transferring glycine dehydrogenase subunit GcvPA [Diplocloster agilis]|uniref:Probable glycine dehydrogenase (decarboxylating) subunit 1 n=1 Tax=Diplocloster agilis TaxID=2850323 RepID=A0A949K0B9_9FIRM|nr:aminomethyl-transferring glycine dehydrogenase subunit GcvPA [Diplocloster agilis]MBU9736992.1 aminomethyl-transferring glycine dehydrogenase subunit GcvPA [Diplocloster agilis]